jgi:N-acetylglucosamine-6-phosphate deacetylase
MADSDSSADQADQAEPSGLVITGGALILEGRAAPVERNLACRVGRIVAIGEAASMPNSQVLDATGLLVAPGFVDTQINGGFGLDFATEPESIPAVAARLPAFGVTSFLPTIISSPSEIVGRALAVIGDDPPQARQPVGAQAVGLHLEGPMLAPSRAGAHNRRHLRAFTSDEVDRVAGSGRVRLVTLAPELPGAAEVIARLVAGGVAVSLGHSEATAQEVARAVDAGAGLVTHLYNAMTPLHHRQPGLVGAALADPRLGVGIIADGVHVDPVAVRVAWNACGPDRLILVTDAIAALGQPPGRSRLGDRPVEITEAGVRTSDDGVLAGSNLTMLAAVRNLVAFTGCSEVEAIRAASTIPARAVGLARKGRIEIGCDADLVLLDDALTVVATIVDGRVVFDRRSR